MCCIRQYSVNGIFIFNQECAVIQLIIVDVYQIGGLLLNRIVVLN